MSDTKISALTSYTTPLNADLVPIVDTANTTTKQVSWSNIKATLKTYFDTLYPSGSGTSTGTNTGDQTISDATITTTDITTNNFTTSKHGFVPKGTNVGSFLKDDGTWAAPTVANASTTVNGTVEAATSAQVSAGTATGETGAVLAVTPDALAASAPTFSAANLTNIGGLFGSYASATTASNVQVTKDTLLFGYVTIPQNNTNTSSIVADSSATPSTTRATFASSVTGAPGQTFSFCIPVKKNEYYNITVGASHSATAFTIPIGV